LRERFWESGMELAMIHITKSGLKRIEWNSDLREYVEAPLESPIRMLRDAVDRVEADVLLADIIRLVAQDSFLNAFISEWSMCDVDAFYKELQKGYNEIAPDDDVKYCTVTLHVEVDYHEPGKYKALPDRQLTTSMDFAGRGNDETNWALDLSPLAEIAGLPFRLTPESICSVTTHGEEIKFERHERFEYTPSLLEVLDAVFYDLSFHGSPQQRAEFSLGLEEIVTKIDEGRAKLVPFSTVDKETVN
jgi:hypothetical protein